MATKIRGYVWGGNYRGFDLYYGKRDNLTIAKQNDEIAASVEGLDPEGEIARLIDYKLEMMGY